MKVLVASHLYPSPISRTAGSFVHNQVRFLQAHCQIEVVSPTPWFPLPGCGRWSEYRSLAAREVLDGVPLRRPRYLTLPRRVFFAQVWRSYLRALERCGGTPDLIHAHWAYPDGYAAVEWGRRLGRPVLLTVHGSDLKEMPQGNPRWKELIGTALRRAAGVVAVSAELGELVRDFGVEQQRISLVPNGVDSQVFCHRGQRRPGEGGWRLLYVGRFDPAKGLGVLLEALAQLRQRRQDVELTLVGGNPATGSGQPFVEQVNSLGLEDCVRFVDEVPWSQLPDYMNAADFFVLPSFSEGFPLVLLEAMACGLPLVATRCGGPEEIVDQQVGRLVDVGDGAGLAATLAEMMENYGLYQRAKISQRARALYDYRSLAEGLAGIYRDVLERA